MIFNRLQMRFKIRAASYLFIAAIIQSCSTPENKEVIDNSRDVLQMIELSTNCQNDIFPSTSHPIGNQLVVFFNSKSCPSCITDVKSYIDVMNRNYEVNAMFYTNKDGRDLNGIDKVIPSLKIIGTDKIFSELNFPLIFETDGAGHIVNCNVINSSYMYLSYNYIKKYASMHPREQQAQSVKN